MRGDNGKPCENCKKGNLLKLENQVQLVSPVIKVILAIVVHSKCCDNWPVKENELPSISQTSFGALKRAL